jgi:hypothetical protein
VRQRIPKTINSNITDNGTPNSHIITMRDMKQPFPVSVENAYDALVESFLLRTPDIQQLPCHFGTQINSARIQEPGRLIRERRRLARAPGSKDYNDVL